MLDTLEYLRHETEVWFELTTLLIPGLNDSDAEVDAMTGWVVEHLGPDVPMHFTAFHPDFKMLDRPGTPPATLPRARRIALENGVRYAYTGQRRRRRGQSTYCHGCGAEGDPAGLVRVGGYELDDRGMCSACGTRMPGVFDGPAGGMATETSTRVARPRAVVPKTRDRSTLCVCGLPAVAGSFYPADPVAPPRQAVPGVRRCHAEAPDGDRPGAKALIVPHAGYRYSGPVAASAYVRLATVPRAHPPVSCWDRATAWRLDGLAVYECRRLRHAARQRPDEAVRPHGGAPRGPVRPVTMRPTPSSTASRCNSPSSSTCSTVFELLPLAVGRCLCRACDRGARRRLGRR